jgi:hypothetical protein
MPCTVKTALDVSIAMRLYWVMDGSRIGDQQLEFWHAMPWGRPPQHGWIEMRVRDQGNHPMAFVTPCHGRTRYWRAERENPCDRRALAPCENAFPLIGSSLAIVPCHQPDLT